VWTATTDSPDAYIIYLPAAPFSKMTRDLLAYVAEDPTFPKYSTGDQSLDDEQFRHLVQLGKQVTKTAIEDPHVRQRITSAIPPPPDK
jgi:hypothetical protein